MGDELNTTTEPGGQARFVNASGNGAALQQPSQMLNITSPDAPLDDLALRALKATSDAFAKVGKAEGFTGKTDTTEAALIYIRQKGLSSQIGRLTSAINRSGLDDVSRRLLATKNIYPYLLLKALVIDEVKSSDLDGLRFSVMLHLKEGDKSPKARLVAALIDRVLEDEQIRLGGDSEQRVRADIAASGFSLLKGKVKPPILAAVQRVRDQGELPALVEAYFTIGEVTPAFVSPAVKAAMVRNLRALSLNVTREGFDAGEYDEYFAVAYDNALRTTSGDQDPVSLKFGSADAAAAATAWDFSIDEFETTEEQGIVTENIAAAGALYYIFELGERMGVFRLADELVLRSAAGTLDLPEGDASARLFRYFKLRQDRSPVADRALLYKRALDAGEATVLESAVINEDFPQLWHKLMEEVATYIEKSEKAVDFEEVGTKVSRSGIYEATRNLQYNLTEHMTGMAHMQVREMYAHLREALDLLGHPEIVDYYATGRQKNRWKVMSNLGKEVFKRTIPVSAIRNAAVEGNRVFQWLTKFDGPGSVQEKDFRDFLTAAEAWILAQGTMGEEIPHADEETPAPDESDGESDDADSDTWDE